MTVTFNIRISAHPKRSTKEEKKSRAILRGHAQNIYLFPFTLKKGGVRIQKRENIRFSTY